MAKDPAFLFYYQDFLVGTEFMSAEEVGLYIKILCHLADKGRLSLKHMQSICKGYAFSDSLKEKFSIDEDGFYYQKRLQKEVEKRRSYTESRRKNAKAYAKHMENENENENRDKDLKVLKKRYAEKVTMTEDEYNKLVHSHGSFYTEKAIFALDNYKGANGKTYASDYKAILAWTMDKVKKEFPVSAGQDVQKVTKINREGLKQFESLAAGAIKNK